MLAAVERNVAPEAEASLSGIDTGRIDPKILLSEKDRECVLAFDGLNSALVQYSSVLVQYEKDVETGQVGSKEAFLQIRIAHEKYLSRVKELYRVILSHDGEAIQAVYDLRKQVYELASSVTHLDHTLRAVQGSKAYRFAEQLRSAFHSLKGAVAQRPAGQASDGPAAPAQSAPASEAPASTTQEPVFKDGISGIAEEHGFLAVQNPYAKVDNRGTSFDIFRNWVTVFHYQDRMYGSQSPLVNDWIPNLTDLNKIYPMVGKRVLEIGSLEGGNTKQLLDLGAKEVVGIESSAESFVKSVIAKNEMNLHGAKFVFGDCNKVLAEKKFHAGGKFDLCYASGVLYHMEEPLRTIDLLSESSDVIYVWSQVASERMPAGDWVTLSDAVGRTYSGRINKYTSTSHIGGLGQFAVWLTKDSLHQAFTDRGFRIEELGGRQTYKGESSEFLARR